MDIFENIRKIYVQYVTFLGMVPVYRVLLGFCLLQNITNEKSKGKETGKRKGKEGEECYFLFFFLILILNVSLSIALGVWLLFSQGWTVLCLGVITRRFAKDSNMCS